MPSNWLHIDSNFPTFTGEESVGDKVTTIQNYMYMLVEQLRYTLHNLDQTNINKTAAERFSDMITEPVYARIENAEGSITQLGVTAEGLGVRVSNAEGSITSLSVTAEGLQSQVNGQSGQISSLAQTVNGFRLSASNGSSSSTLTLTSGGVVVSSAVISFSGIVMFSDLSTAGRTIINGGNITSGTITGVTLRSVAGQDSGFQIYANASSFVGGIRYDDQGAGTIEEARNRMFVYTNGGWSLKMRSGAGLSLEGTGIYAVASDRIHLTAPSININGYSLKNYILGVVDGTI